MTLHDFNTLELSKKSDLVWEWGYLIGSRKLNDHNIALFLVNDFLAEVYITLTDNKTTLINGISKNDLHPDFKNMLNPKDPFVKAFLKLGDSSSKPEAA
jgi:hypothetical protein